MLRNPHLEGEAFFWEGGPVGVLLVHGFTATTAEVRPLGRVLHGQGYTVAGPLLPGHRTNPVDANRYRWQDWDQAVEKTYRQLAGRCERVFVGGESTGAVLSLLLASRYPQIAGILAYAPALKINLQLTDRILLHLIALFQPYIPKPNTKRQPNRSDELWQGYPVNPLRGAIQLLRLQRAVRPLLPGIRQPVLVIQGRLDPTVDPEVPEIIDQEIGSRYKEIHWLEESAHCVMIDCEMERAAALTLKFIERVLAGLPAR